MTIAQALLSFAAVAGLLTLAPGIDTALVLRSSISRTRSFAFATALGICTGAMVWGVAAAVGVSALLAASDVAYRILTLAGAGYMVWLGAALIWKTWKNGPVLMGLLLAGVHCLLAMVWFSALIFGTQFASTWLKNARSIRLIDRITGGVLIGFGVKVALEPAH